jgi:hypothetical protein
MAGKKTEDKNKKKKSFLGSKEMKRVYWVLGAPLVLLLFWYIYTVATVIDKTGMDELQAALKQKAVRLTKRADREGFNAVDFKNCENRVAEYGGRSKAALPELLGIPKRATKEDIIERCVLFARAVTVMEKMAHHKKHVFVCGGSMLDIAKEGAFHIKPDPQGRGAFQTIDPNSANFIKIRPGNFQIVKWWQVYNVGDGCIIVGYSKSGSPRLKPKVAPTEQ